MRPVKYETVIGIIGNTHGVSSESAPIAAASHRYAPNVLARDAVARSGTGARGVSRVRIRDGRGHRERFAVRSNRPGFWSRGGLARVPTATFSVSSTSLGGRHSLSLHV